MRLKGKIAIITMLSMLLAPINIVSAATDYNTPTTSLSDTDKTSSCEVIADIHYAYYVSMPAVLTLEPYDYAGSLDLLESVDGISWRKWYENRISVERRNLESQREELEQEWLQDLEEALANGTVTQEQYNNYRANIPTLIDNMINASLGIYPTYYETKYQIKAKIKDIGLGGKYIKVAPKTSSFDFGWYNSIRDDMDYTQEEWNQVKNQYRGSWVYWVGDELVNIEDGSTVQYSINPMLIR